MLKMHYKSAKYIAYMKCVCYYKYR